MFHLPISLMLKKYFLEHFLSYILFSIQLFQILNFKVRDK